MELTPLALLLAQIAAILLASRAVALVTRRLGQPLVIAEMVAGIALGPSLLGLVWPSAYGVLFPTSSMPALKMLSQFGLVLFMFLVGLELDPALLRGRRRASVLISNVGILLPFVLGVGSAWLIHETHAPKGVPFLPFALFLGTALSVTAFPVLARILSERGLTQSRVGAIALACAAVDDVSAWCLLAFVAAIARAGALGEAIWTVGLAAVFSLFMLVVARPLLRRFGSAVAEQGGLTSTRLVVVFVLLLASSGITELIGIHALFGAFLFGVVMPKEDGLAAELAGKLESTAVLLLMPLFFAYSGLRTHIGLLGGAGEWAVALGLIAVATLGKFGGGTLAARVTGLNWREAGAIGVLMNTRGLMELIVLNVGMDLGVITPTIFTMLVLMALVTTFATTPLLRWIYSPMAAAESARSDRVFVE
ncbi:MAG TPA: cation:proton antiporter [Polyangiaceae bacterium]|nr:cation:proton antiporter [Polyangiaceae bacterium]